MAAMCGSGNSLNLSKLDSFVEVVTFALLASQGFRKDQKLIINEKVLGKYKFLYLQPQKTPHL